LKGYSNNRLAIFKYLTLAFIPLLFLLFSCSSMLNVYTVLSDAQYISPDYRAVLEKCTRKGSMYKGLKTELLVASTYKTEEFRKAYTEEYCKIYSLTPRQSKMMMDDQMQAANDYDDFLVSIHAEEKQWDNFSERNSLWNVFLLRDGYFREKPLEVREVKEKRILYESFYPFISPWSSVYVFRFKKTDKLKASESLEFVLAGVPGSIRLKWDH